MRCEECGGEKHKFHDCYRRDTVDERNRLKREEERNLEAVKRGVEWLNRRLRLERQ
jgi:hypothetical protein